MLRRVRTSCVRRLATLSAKEEFPSAVAVAPAVRAAAVIKEATTSNGVKLIARDSGASVVTLNFAVLCGSRAESLSEKGAAHLLSVAGFAGTGKRSGLRLMRDLENIGAVVGTSSDREKITYKVTVLPEMVEAAVAAVAEAITSAPTSSYVVEDLKDTAQISIDAHKASPKEQVMELLYEAAFGENTPMGSPTFGPLDKLDVSSVMAFRKSHFSAGNLVVSASGISIDTLKTLAELYLHALPAATSGLALPSSPYVGGDMKVRADVGASHLALAFPVPKGAAAEPYKVLFGILSSKVAAAPIPKGSLVPFFEQHSSGALMGFYAAGHAQAATGYLEAGVAELKALASSADAADAAKVKTALTAFLKVEGSGESVASSLIDSTLFGVPPLHDARSVTSASVSAAAKAALASVPSYAVFGVTAGTPSFNSVLKLTK